MAVGTAARDRVERLDRIWQERPGFTGWLTTTDHKRIGILYLVTSLVFFAAGGVEALVMRTQLAEADQRVVGPGTYDQLMTMHGITMIFFFVIPLSIGFFGNYLVPLMIGARDMAFPRMNALSYWLYLGSGILLYSGLALGHAPDAGWFNYVPLASRKFSPGSGIDFYALGLILNSLSSTAAAANFLVTIGRLRAPGMSLNRMPLFCFAILATSFSLVFALPALTTDLVFLELSRRFGLHFFDVGRGGNPLLWQDLFWIFGHPEVYIIVLPAFGIATSIIPTFTRRRMAAFPLVALAELLVAFIGFGVWVHHMFATGLPEIAMIFFAAASLIIVIPSGIQIFAWCMTMVTGKSEFRTPLLFIVGFILFFVFGGLSGIMLAAIPFDQQVTDTYFVVAHFHYVIWGAAVFPLLGGLYYWFPKVTGRMYNERLGQTTFWMVFIGTNVTFFPMHISGMLGMPRRVWTYPGYLGWGPENFISTLGAFFLTGGLVLMAVNLVVSRVRGPLAGPNPFGGATLEWATSSPPPPYNFAVIPKVSSPYATWDEGDRATDPQRLEQGDFVLERGHLTPGTTPVDGHMDEILAMPEESPWPVTLAFVATLGTAFVIANHLILAIAMVALAAVVLVAWHSGEPEAA
ncbi:MAG TPA: cytochrome c oxidase subunit I [Gaiellales bacterium]|nr:cytochrome c oxidase subunit I [Gaiellales bacterium]